MGAEQKQEIPAIEKSSPSTKPLAALNAKIEKISEEFISSKENSRAVIDRFVVKEGEDYASAKNRIVTEFNLKKLELESVIAGGLSSKSIQDRAEAEGFFRRKMVDFDINFKSRLADFAQATSFNQGLDPQSRIAASRDAESLRVQSVIKLLGAPSRVSGALEHELISLGGGGKWAPQSDNRGIISNFFNDKRLVSLADTSIKSFVEEYAKVESPAIRENIKNALLASLEISNQRHDPNHAVRYLDLLHAISDQEHKEAKAIIKTNPAAANEILRVRQIDGIKTDLMESNLSASLSHTEKALRLSREATEAAKKIYYASRSSESASLVQAAIVNEIGHLNAECQRSGQKWTTANIENLRNELVTIRDDYAQSNPKDAVTISGFNITNRATSFDHALAIQKTGDFETEGKRMLQAMTPVNPKTAEENSYEARVAKLIRQTDKGEWAATILEGISMYATANVLDKMIYGAVGAGVGCAVGGTIGAALSEGAGAVPGCIRGAKLGFAVGMLVPGGERIFADRSVIRRYTSREFDGKFFADATSLATDLVIAGTLVKSALATPLKPVTIIERPSVNTTPAPEVKTVIPEGKPVDAKLLLERQKLQELKRFHFELDKIQMADRSLEVGQKGQWRGGDSMNHRLFGVIDGPVSGVATAAAILYILTDGSNLPGKLRNVVAIPEKVAREMDSASAEMKAARELHSASAEILERRQSQLSRPTTQLSYDVLTTSLLEVATDLAGEIKSKSGDSHKITFHQTHLLDLLALRSEMLKQAAEQGTPIDPRYTAYAKKDGGLFFLWKNQDNADVIPTNLKLTLNDSTLGARFTISEKKSPDSKEMVTREYQEVGFEKAFKEVDIK